MATDGSKYGQVAVEEAASIAKRCGGELVVISVVPSEADSPFDIVHVEMQRGLIAENEFRVAEETVRKVIDMTKKEGVNAEGLILAGRPYEAIISTAREKKADLIVMGSHGRTGLDKLLMGSVTERVIVLSPCSVLVIKIK